MFLLITGALVAAGILLLRRASATRRELDRYAFENRTDGGVIQFPDFETAERHRRRGERIGLQVTLGMLLLLVGGLGLLGGLLFSSL